MTADWRTLPGVWDKCECVQDESNRWWRCPEHGGPGAWGWSDDKAMIPEWQANSPAARAWEVTARQRQTLVEQEALANSEVFIPVWLNPETPSVEDGTARSAGIDRRPHSRACGIAPHSHGTACSRDCPTCGGKESSEPAPFVSSAPAPYDELSEDDVHDLQVEVAFLQDITKRIIDAWTVEGNHPLYHRRMKSELFSDWPTLATAIMDLVRANNR